jgi:hypothetical protein
MNSDEIIPDDDTTANAARRTLHQLADGRPIELSWASVQGRARRVKQQRLSVIGAACAVVLISAAVAAATAGSNGGNQIGIAGGSQPTTTLPPSASTSTSLPYDSSSAAPTLPGGSSPVPPPTTGTPIVLPNLPSTSPLPGDFRGAITVSSATATGPTEIGIGETVDVDAVIQNITNREIWASSASVPTSVATICSSDSASSAQTLWWMTNILMQPGDTDGRTGSFTPTAAYAGTVTCEVVIVTTDQQGTEFDQSAGGDAATAAVIGRVSGIPPVTFLVSVAPPDGSTTTTTDTVPTTETTVP